MTQAGYKQSLKPGKPGYKYLRSYQLSVLIYDLTSRFVKRWILSLRTRSQMEQAARSGKQNIAEGYLEKSLKGYIYLLGVSYASLGELLEDYEDFLRQSNLKLWDKDDARVKKFREFRVFGEESLNTPNTPKLPSNPEEAANLLITLLHLDLFLLFKQGSALEEKFIKEGGFTENLFKKRMEERRKR